MVETDHLRGTWDGLAGAWEAHADHLALFTDPVRERLIEHLGPARSGVLLEVAAGTGDLSRRLAREARHVISTDLSPRMIAAARRRAERDGVDHIELHEIDVERLPFDDASVDGVVCQSGIMLVADPRAALAECRRVLRQDGRIVISTWGPAERNPWLVMLGAALVHHGLLDAGDPGEAGGVFSLADPDVLTDLLAGAGFVEVQVDRVALAAHFATFDEYWSLHGSTSGRAAIALAALDDETRQLVRVTCEEFCAYLRTEDGYRFPGEALVAVGAPSSAQVTPSPSA